MQASLSQLPNRNPLLGPVESFAVEETQNGLKISPVKLYSYLLTLFLIFSSGMIFYMSLDSSLEGRGIVRTLLVLMSLCAISCSYFVYKKGFASLLFNRGGQFIEYVETHGQSRLIDAKSMSINLVKETVTSVEDTKGYDQFKLVTGSDTLFQTRKLSYMNELIQKMEAINFKVNRTF